MALCFVCDRPITETFMVCRDCAEQYGLTTPFKDWPAWAKVYFADKRKERRLDEAGTERALSDLPIFEARRVEGLLYGDPIRSDHE